MTLNGSEIIVKSLVDSGVEVIFGYPGGAVLPLYDEIFKQNHLRHILVRHEQGAAHAAEGYARSTGKIGVVLVTSGPGATNTVTGLADAYLDSIPLLCITGQVATPLMGSDAFQEADTVGITRSCTKHNYLVKDINDLERVIKEAIYIATTGRPGPVVIDIPKDIQIISSEYKNIKKVSRESYHVTHNASEKIISEAVELIAKAKNPVFYTGGGVINSGKEASKLLTKFVHMTGYPITNTLMGLGSFPARDEHFLGMLGMHGSREANMCMHECDVMINIGARFDDRITGKLDKFSPNSKKIHIDIDPSSINKNILVDIPIIGDAKQILEQMIAVWDKYKDLQDKQALAKWWDKIHAWRKQKSFTYNQPEDGLAKPQYVLDILNKLLAKRDSYVTTDVGQHQMWSAQFLQFEEPNRWMTSGGLGTMGYGLPAAVGTQIAHPKATVVCVTGEASIMMNIQELSTAVQYRLPVKILILNNHYMGMVRQWQEMFFGDRHSESYMDALPDFVKLAEAYGMTGLRGETAADVEAVLEKMLNTDGPVIVDMIVDPKENVYPMIPAGAGHHEMEFGPMDKKQIDANDEDARMQV